MIASMNRRLPATVPKPDRAMALRIKGYYAILDVKGSSLDLAAARRHASALLAAKPCCRQLRAKQLGLAGLCALGHAQRGLCAHAIHLGQGDLPRAEVLRVRSAARAHALAIGISTHDLEQAKAAVAGGADYIGFGPVFRTQTKADADSAVGLAALQEVATVIHVPVVAIGGITLDNVAAVAMVGASAAAAIATVDGAPDRTLAGRRIALAFAAA